MSQPAANSHRTPATPGKHQLARWSYNAAVAVTLPLLSIWLLWRVTVGGKARGGLTQRLGILPKEAVGAPGSGPPGPTVWIHAVSVGEVSVAQAVIHELLARRADLRIALSVTTATGYRVAQGKLAANDILFYLPVDLPLCVDAALDTLRPDMLILVETELWPNLIDAAHRRGVRAVVCNGRLSDRSFQGARRVRWLYQWVLSSLDRILVQSEQDAERFRALGAPAEAVSVTGNCKFDEPFPEVSPEEVAAMREEYGLLPDGLVWLTGSTGPGEDAPILDAFEELRRTLPHLRLIHAPRHPERADEVADAIRSRGLEVLRRTRIRDGFRPPMGHDAVILLDTIGELTRLYALCDVAFVGRSLVPLGGGNVLQPLHYGKPVIVGPHTTNFRDIVAIVRQAGVLVEVADGRGLVREVARVLSDPSFRAGVADRARAVFEQHSGASARTAEGVLAYLRMARYES